LFLGILTVLAWQIPIGETFSIGSFSIHINDSFSLFGRQFILGASSNGLIILIYLITGVWFIGALANEIHPLFPALSLGMVALLVAALMVQPFLYAALLIETAVLVSIPMLIPPGTPAQQGVLRYLIFQTLAMPFILFTGWMLSGIETGTVSTGLQLRAAVMLGFGFAFLLAIFPFFSWIPLLTEQNEPYIAGFLFIIMQTVGLLFAVKFIDQYEWLRDNPLLYQILQSAGIIMVVSGGLLSAFQIHLGRIFGYGVIFETGTSLLAISLIPTGGLDAFCVQFIPRTIAMVTWTLGLSALKHRWGSLSFAQVRGSGRSEPLLVGCILIANLSVVGLPLLGAFPARLSLWEEFSGVSAGIGLWSLAGTMGLLIGAIRSTNALFSGEQWNLQKQTSLVRSGLLCIGIIVLFILGSQPQWFLPDTLRLADAFPNLIH
jgi:formate hydrogenlyase subunit 3/multisubunit Na+/H+ antiporter MnhD subunit